MEAEAGGRASWRVAKGPIMAAAVMLAAMMKLLMTTTTTLGGSNRGKECNRTYQDPKTAVQYTGPADGQMVLCSKQQKQK